MNTYRVLRLGASRRGAAMRLRRRRLLQMAGVAAFAAASRIARAEAYPARAVRLIVPFGPASGVDIAARLFADRLGGALGPAGGGGEPAGRGRVPGDRRVHVRQ